MTLAGKVGLVTGGGRGIGRGIALALAGAGADIALADIDRLGSAAQQYGEATVGGYQAARETVREIQSRGRRAIAIEADVTDAKQVEAMVNATVADLSGLDILVCNAG